MPLNTMRLGIVAQARKVAPHAHGHAEVRRNQQCTHFSETWLLVQETWYRKKGTLRLFVKKKVHPKGGAKARYGKEEREDDDNDETIVKFYFSPERVYCFSHFYVRTPEDTAAVIFFCSIFRGGRGQGGVRMNF